MILFNRLTNQGRYLGIIVALIGLGAAILLVRPVVAELIGATPKSIADFSNVVLATETVNGYQQIIYIKDGNRAFLTSGHFNHTNPQGKGQYVVWQTSVNGANQIELYDVARDMRVPVTMEGTNQNAKVDSSGRVVWERWVDDRWQVMYYDGASARQITKGDGSVRPDISDEMIIFSSKGRDNVWRAKKYNIESKSVEIIKEGQNAAYPYIENKNIKFL